MLKMKFQRGTCTSVLLHLIVFTLCLSLVHCNIYEEFLNFIKTYGKTYKEGSQEFKQRFLNFQENRKIQEQLNKAQDVPSAVYGVTKFSDLSFKEFKDIYLSGLKPQHYDVWTNTTETPLSKLRKLKIPPKLDWRTEQNYSIITAIKDQQKCGGCWAFCTVECIESVYAMKVKQPPKELSVQEVLDCDSFDGGCAGGDICTALQWMTLNKVNLVSESEYPLKDVTGTCKIKPQQSKGVQVKSHDCYRGKTSLIGHEDKILELLYTKGPVAVAVDAKTWYNYQGGIIQYHCETDNNHAVQIVGYDTTGDIPYYIVRNSWGDDFGDNGYLYIKIGGNLCGIAKEVATIDVGKTSLIGHEDKILELLYTKGPVAVAVDAKTWYNYQGGIIQYHCETDNNHAVQIVGYDTTGDIPYYIVRNSWGDDFGDNGYLYIKIGGNLCGIAKEVATIDVYV